MLCYKRSDIITGNLGNLRANHCVKSVRSDIFWSAFSRNPIGKCGSNAENAELY